MKKILLFSCFSFLAFLCSFNSKAQYQYTANHPHHHISPSCTYNSHTTGDETWFLGFEECPDEGVYVTFSEIVVSIIDANNEWVELASANSNNSSTGECHTPIFTIPGDRLSLSYYFYIEYSDGTYEMVNVTY